MYIIVIGGGKIGYHLAKALLAEDHEVLVIEKDRQRADYICSELGSICLWGDGCETATLNEAGTGRAGMLIAVTGDDEDNLVSCQLAKYRYKVQRTVARLTNPKNETLFRMLGIDVTVSSTDVIMEYIGQEVPTHLLTHLMTIQDRGIEIVEVKIPEGARSIGRQVRDIRLPTGSVLMLIIRRDQRPLLPDQDTKIQEGDQIIALTATDTEDLLKTALQGG